MLKQCRKLRAKLAGAHTLKEKKHTDIKKSEDKISKKRSVKNDKIITDDWKQEQKYIKLLLLGPGEAGKSTLIKQMQIINGAPLDPQEKLARISNIRQNIFDSMVAILVAMKEFDIPLTDVSLVDRAQILLNHSQVTNPKLTSKDILHSDFLKTDEFLEHVSHLWHDPGVRAAYERAHEYQLLDSAAYFFDRIEVIRQQDYIPSEQDVLRCRVMTTSITETRFTVPCGNNQKGHFKVIDVGGQRGDRRKWITLFDRVTAVLFVQDISSFDQTLREDINTNRLLESLKVFYQVISTKFLQSVSILTFLNKIDILKEKIGRGADFADALEKIKKEALFNATNDNSQVYSKYDKQVYQKLYDILTENPYESFQISDIDRKQFSEAFPTPEPDHNHNTHSIGRKFRLLNKKPSSSSLHYDINDKVVKAAAYMRFLLKEIINRVDKERTSTAQFVDTLDYRSYEFHYTCAVDKNNVTKVMEGCKNIIIRDHLAKWGVPLYS